MAGKRILLVLLLWLTTACSGSPNLPVWTLPGVGKLVYSGVCRAGPNLTGMLVASEEGTVGFLDSRDGEFLWRTQTLNHHGKLGRVAVAPGCIFAR